jgi:hypothetical protein
MGGILDGYLSLQNFHVQNAKWLQERCCDCEGAIKAYRGISQATCRWKSYDIATRIKTEIESSDLFFIFQYISAHQDGIKAYDELDEWEQANVQVNKLAKTSLQQFERQGCPKVSNPVLKGHKWMLLL